MITTDKKTLLILFGELRTFEYVIPILKKLNDVDIILSTWLTSSRFNSLYHVDEQMIKSVLPNVKQIHITDHTKIPNIENRGNSWKMFWHWQYSINNLNESDYDLVIVHRCDFISNWHTILDLNIEDDTIYFHHGIKPHFKENPNAFWINDYYFFGKFDIIKTFINSFTKDTYYIPHLPIWEVITENRIKIKNHILHGFLLRDNDIEYAIEFLKSNKDTTYHLSTLTGPE
jgi:hypothetical protein